MSSHASEAFRAHGPYLIVQYDQELSSDLTNDILSIHAHRLLDRLSEAGWHRAGLDIASCLISDDLHTLCHYDPDVLDLGAHDQSVIRQVLAYFGKRDDIELGLDREAAAREKFWAAERACKVTNMRFHALATGNLTFHPYVHGILHAALRKIAEVLGDAPCWDDIRLRLGPGATTRTPKKNACPIVKWKAGPACSANFDSVSDAMSSYNSIDSDEGVADVFVDDARIAFVPKTFKTKRAICTEPSVNGMFQLGIGDLIADRLKTVGIDIHDQGPNQRAALYGSISGVSATLDLSSASDTVAIGLVMHLLPVDWFALLDQVRSRTVIDGGRVYHLEKISSMGNGFTFALETLIFWALARSVSETNARNSRIRTLAYGDDLIVDVRAAEPLAWVLSELGFTLNKDKSFWSGTFRESCGCDYVSGIDVRPVFVKDALTGADFFRIHNFYRRKGDLDSANYFKKFVDPSVCLLGPEGFGDGHFHSDDYPVKESSKNGWGGMTFQTWTQRPRSLRSEIAKQLARKVKTTVPRWDGKGWRSSEIMDRLEYHSKHDFLVRKLATYTQYLRETRPLTLTPSDKQRSIGRDVYCDRRMPDPVSPGTFDDIFVVPGAGSVVRTKVYIFNRP